MEKYGDMEIHFIIKLLWGYLQKVGCNKKYKNVRNSVIIDYFVHYQMFLTIISYTKTTSRQKRLWRLYSIWSKWQLQIIWQCLYKFFLENFLRIQQHKQKECN